MVPEAVAVLAYVGPPPLTAARMLTSWRLDPGVLAAVAALGGSYRLGLGRWRRAGRRWPRARAAGYAAGGVSGRPGVGAGGDGGVWGGGRLGSPGWAGVSSGSRRRAVLDAGRAEHRAAH